MGRNTATARRGNAALLGLKRTLKTLPTTIAVDVAARAGPAMTDQARGAHGSRRGVYGDAYPVGVDGQQLDVRRTGAVASGLGFRATGTQIRCVLDQKYARYLVGKYNVLPNGAIPEGWRRELATIVKQTRVVL